MASHCNGSEAGQTDRGAAKEERGFEAGTGMQPLRGGNGAAAEEGRNRSAGGCGGGTGDGIGWRG